MEFKRELAKYASDLLVGHAKIQEATESGYLVFRGSMPKELLEMRKQHKIEQ